MDQWVGATRGTDLELVVEPDGGCQAPEDARDAGFDRHGPSA
jgi:hypothetical protein